MSINYNESSNSLDRPPLPPKNIFKNAPPLPPKVTKSKELLLKETKQKIRTKKKASSCDFIRNNNSYSLSSINDKICIKEDKILEKKDVYENYERSIDTSFNKKKSILYKMKKLLKISNKTAQSLTNSDLTSESSQIVNNNKYNEIPDNNSSISFSNLTCSKITCSNSTCSRITCSNSICSRITCSNSICSRIACSNSMCSGIAGSSLTCSSCSYCSHCRPCHCLLNHHNFHHFRCDNLPNLSNCCHRRNCGVMIPVNILSPITPIIPNRVRPQVPPEVSSASIDNEEFELKAFVPVRHSPMEKYSRNFLNRNLIELKKVGWYWGSVSSTEAERVMTDQSDGTFLVRDSAHSDHLFSVTFRVNNLTYHARIQFSQNKFWWNRNNRDDGFESISDLIKNSMEISQRGEYRFFENSENVNVPAYAVSLLNPLSRFKVMSSLKHLARFVIISNVRNDHLQQLPIPPHLLSYLYDKEHHYIEDFENYLNIFDHGY